jgi:hypothetical protein
VVCAMGLSSISSIAFLLWLFVHETGRLLSVCLGRSAIFGPAHLLWEQVVERDPRAAADTDDSGPGGILTEKTVKTPILRLTADHESSKIYLDISDIS